ncbi:MAG: dihydroorotate dehydrogenase (quinone) [Gammaproteobacteria bacterium]|nr:dihydroorotate dehydrogenase (quinone) [Gammaproteobacteria bacterium]
MYKFIRRLLFLFPAEFSHHLGLKGLQVIYKLGLSSLLAAKSQDAPLQLLGLNFKNPVGLAAGLDKNADYLDALGSLGFGFIEVGTVTPKPQAGNPKPRLFRLAADHALINRMGFNNKGVEHLVSRLKKRRYQGIVGVNIGKNLSTPVSDAHKDYLLCLQRVYPYADYIVVNLSSPNTPGLRKLQFGEELDKLLSMLRQEQLDLQEKHQRHVPLLLKIAPDLKEQECQDIALALLTHNFDGVIATNTTIARDGLQDKAHVGQSGGLSGAPLLAQSSKIVHLLQRYLQGAIPIIAVGGIDSAETAKQKFRAGAKLVQVYTGFIYEGPALIENILAAQE